MTRTATPRTSRSDGADGWAPDWRHVGADALEARVVAITNWLAATDDLVEQADHYTDGQLAQVLRSAAGLVRERRDRLVDQARDLRMATK